MHKISHAFSKLNFELLSSFLNCNNMTHYQQIVHFYVKKLHKRYYLYIMSTIFMHFCIFIAYLLFVVYNITQQLNSYFVVHYITVMTL